MGSNNEQQRVRGRDDDIEVRTPMGWGVRASGRVVSMLLLVVTAVVLIAWMIRDHDIRSAGQLADISHERSTQMLALATRQDKLQESMDVVIYILSVPPEDRVKFKLDMPPQLRARLLSQERSK